MGIEAGDFVHPERISPELYCPICTCVLENPVQTPSEHLFCEDELLEWMISSDVCPVTKTNLNPDDIKKPGRIITNLLGELERYCPNRSAGCEWQGKNYSIEAHVQFCSYKSREQISKEMAAKDATIEKLKQRSDRLQAVVETLEREKCDLQETVQLLSKRLKIYDAFLKEAEGDTDTGGGTGGDTKYREAKAPDGNEDGDDGDSNGGTSMTDLERIARLRRLDMLVDEVASGPSRVREHEHDRQIISESKHRDGDREKRRAFGSKV